MKRIFLSIFISLIALVGGIAFITKNYSTTIDPKRDYVIVSGYGEHLYDYPLPFQKGVEFIDVVHTLENNMKDPIKIYAKHGRIWEEVKPHAKLYHDATFKIDI